MYPISGVEDSSISDTCSGNDYDDHMFCDLISACSHCASDFLKCNNHADLLILKGPRMLREMDWSEMLGL